MAKFIQIGKLNKKDELALLSLYWLGLLNKKYIIKETHWGDSNPQNRFWNYGDAKLVTGRQLVSRCF